METTKIISPYFENGVFAGVRVTLGDEDFVIAPKDYQNGNKMHWQEAMAALKTDGLDTWNYRQLCFTSAYKEEIDKVLEDYGGDNLQNGYWTGAEFSLHSVFIYYGFSGRLDYYDKSSIFRVRPIKNLIKNKQVGVVHRVRDSRKTLKKNGLIN